MKLEVYVRAGRMQYAWMGAKAVRTRLWLPYPCTDREAPYTRIRWRK